MRVPPGRGMCTRGGQVMSLVDLVLKHLPTAVIFVS